jgi:4-amino-4-deoxy-L-arabinose transferase-like glycosyltransferase
LPPRPDRELPPATATISASERTWLLGAILVGAALRLAFPSRMAAEHFDEGVYASNVLFGAETNYQYPFREFFSPPLLPTVIEWLHIAWGLTGLPVPGWLPMLPALVCGIATIPSLWWIARVWFSPNAGIAAAWLIALCEFHAAYSRTALTDVPLALFLLWAVYWFGRALEVGAAIRAALNTVVARSSGAARIAAPTIVRPALTAGVFTAAAWWTKYNGWLPIAIAATSAVLVLLLLRAPRTAWVRAATVCAIGAVTASVLWLPVLWDCQDVGGYSAIAENHRGYVDGWSAWIRNAISQFDHHAAAYAGWATLVGIGGPTFLAFLLTQHQYGRFISSTSEDEPIPTMDGSRVFGLGINIAIMAVRPGSWFLIVIGTGIVCSALAVRRAVRERTEGLALHAAFALVWVGSLVVVTPLYRAYPRLMLPLIVGALLASSVFWRRGWVAFETPSNILTWWLGPTIAVAIAAGVLAVRGSVVWEDRAGYRSAALTFADDRALPSGENRVVYVIAEPGFFYNLRMAGVPAAIVGDARFLDTASADMDIFVAAGPLVGGTADGKNAWDAVRDRFTPVRELDRSRLSSIVRLDQSADVAHQLAQGERSARYTLYRWNGSADK